eukprot:GEMP01041706.1.p2 GENE.GEMP01041706.1~~GEMP01041706.1.p2  ORF type:complete len:109 (+),score=3.50 GEMP01041706.1:856-1182(+)
MSIPTKIAEFYFTGGDKKLLAPRPDRPAISPFSEMWRKNIIGDGLFSISIAVSSRFIENKNLSSQKLAKPLWPLRQNRGDVFFTAPTPKNLFLLSPPYSFQLNMLAIT